MHKPLPFAEYIRNQGFSYIHLSDCVTDRTSSGARTITREASDTVRDLPHSAGPSRLRRAAPSRRFHAILSRLHSCAVRRGSATRDVAPVCVAVHFSAGSDDQDHDTLQIRWMRMCKLSALHQCLSLTTGFRKGGAFDLHRMPTDRHRKELQLLVCMGVCDLLPSTRHAPVGKFPIRLSEPDRIYQLPLLELGERS